MPVNTITTVNSKILDTVKENLGGDVSSDEFEPELLMHINTTLSILNQMGIGVENFEVKGVETWADFLTITGTTSTEQKFQAVKSYVCLKVRQLFDPPMSSIVAQSIESSLKELEWRIYSLGNF